MPINDIGVLGAIPKELEKFAKQSLFPRADHVHATQRDALTLDGLLKTQFLRSDDGDTMEASEAGNLLILNNTHATGNVLNLQRDGVERMVVSEDSSIRLGDDAGVNKVIIKNLSGTTVAEIDSLGNLKIKGILLKIK